MLQVQDGSIYIPIEDILSHQGGVALCSSEDLYICKKDEQPNFTNPGIKHGCDLMKYKKTLNRIVAEKASYRLFNSSKEEIKNIKVQLDKEIWEFFHTNLERVFNTLINGVQKNNDVILLAEGFNEKLVSNSLILLKYILKEKPVTLLLYVLQKEATGPDIRQGLEVCLYALMLALQMPKVDSNLLRKIGIAAFFYNMGYFEFSKSYSPESATSESDLKQIFKAKVRNTLSIIKPYGIPDDVLGMISKQLDNVKNLPWQYNLLQTANSLYQCVYGGFVVIGDFAKRRLKEPDYEGICQHFVDLSASEQSSEDQQDTAQVYLRKIVTSLCTMLGYSYLISKNNSIFLMMSEGCQYMKRTLKIQIEGGYNPIICSHPDGELLVPGPHGFCIGHDGKIFVEKMLMLKCRRGRFELERINKVYEEQAQKAKSRLKVLRDYPGLTDKGEE
jgi:hypothetical protein